MNDQENPDISLYLIQYIFRQVAGDAQGGAHVDCGNRVIADIIPISDITISYSYFRQVEYLEVQALLGML